MSLDETVHQTFETLSDRLRAELRAAADEIAAALGAERAELLSELDAERARAQSAEAIGAEAAGVEAAAPRDAARNEALLEGIQAVGAARSLSEVLDTLTSSAARETARAGILLVRGLGLRGWRFVGFPQRFDAAETVNLPLSEAGAIADAVRDRSAAWGPDAPAFAELPPGRFCFAAPIVLNGEVVAVLYADDGIAENPEPGTVNPEPGTENEPRTQNPEPRTGNLEILVRFAARCLEAITAFNAVRMLQQHPPAPGGRLADADRVDAGDPSDADAAARRYARLLVSEIKLYHEPDVVAGRRQRDLAARLGAQIARARQLYEQRVSPHVGDRTDYFRAELIRTLADGDASLLEAGT